MTDTSETTPAPIEFVNDYWETVIFTKLIIDGIVLLVAVGVLCNHLRMYYQDFYTVERASVAHRRSPPEINQVYKLVSNFTAAMAVFVVCNAVGTFGMNLVTSNGSCGVLAAVAWTGFLGVKQCIYVVFTLRLKMVYDGSPYEVSKHVLRLLVAICTIWTTVVALCLIIWRAGEDNTNDDEGDDGYTVLYFHDDGDLLGLCFEMQQPWFGLGVMIVFDIVANFVYYTMFIRPIRRVIRSVQASGNKKGQSKIVGKMLRVGLKVGILSTVLVISTFAAQMTFLFEQIWLFSVDTLVNCVCIVLMTPYYPDAKFYHKFCCPCIFCCDREGYTTGKYSGDVGGDGGDNDTTRDLDVTATAADSGSGKTATGSSAGTFATSVDTMSAVRVEARKQGGHDYSNGNGQAAVSADILGNADMNPVKSVSGSPAVGAMDVEYRE